MPSAISRSPLVIRSKSDQRASPPQASRPAIQACPGTIIRTSSPKPIRPSHSPLLRPTHHAYLQQPYKVPTRPHMPAKPTVAVVNASGRQAASFIRVASAVGYHVRAQLRSLDGVVATEISSLPNVTVLVGELTASGEKKVNYALVEELFQGAEVAFINTTFWGDEARIGKALADAAKRVRVRHFIYSSMPDHSKFNPGWPALPLWSAKSEVEDYIRRIGLPATFVYTGIYNNNFTSLPYPLFCLELQQDGSFLWQAPFHPEVRLPWLDAEHDVGPTILQIIKDGAEKRLNQRIPLAFEMLSPVDVCRKFARGIGRPVRYVCGPIEVTVPIPQGYREQLDALETMYALGAADPRLQPPYFGTAEMDKLCAKASGKLWEGFRGIEEYAKEDFLLEEAANGMSWMNDAMGVVQEQETVGEEEDDGDSDVLTMGKRREEEWLA